MQETGGTGKRFELQQRIEARRGGRGGREGKEGEEGGRPTDPLKLLIQLLQQLAKHRSFSAVATTVAFAPSASVRNNRRASSPISAGPC